MHNDAPKKFRSLVKEASYKSKRRVPLTNVVFFLGAGFSKSWDKAYPTGPDLFKLSSAEVGSSDLLSDYLLGLSTGLDGLTESQFKDIVYSINMQIKYPAIRTRYFDVSCGEYLLNELRRLVFNRFHERGLISNYQPGSKKLGFSKRLNSRQKAIFSFFEWLHGIDKQTSHRGFPEGVRFHFLSTNYDFLLETLLDSTVGDDSFCLYTYRGISPASINGATDLLIHPNHSLVSNLFKINGGFELFAFESSYEIDYTLSKDLNFALAPHIMLPSREQSYDDKYFAEVFPKSVRLLQESSILVIVGYSFPEEDSLLRFILRHFAEHASDAVKKYVFSVSKESVAVQKDKVTALFHHSFPKTDTIVPYYGSFATWAKSVVK